MSKDRHISTETPLGGAGLVAHWGFVYDMDEDAGGGFVSGEFLLRSDGVLLRRYGSNSYSKGYTSWRYGAWEPVSWWTGETELSAAIRLLKRHGYDLHRPSPVPIDKQTAGPYPGSPDRAEYL